MAIAPLPPVCFRAFAKSDGTSTWQVFQDAVLNGTASHYSLPQRKAWSGSGFKQTAWSDRLNEQTTILATIEGRTIGFMSLRNDGYLDLAFVNSGLARRRIGSQLYHIIEKEAQEIGLARLFTEASLVAKPFFTRHGWVDLAQQTVERLGQTLPNHRMEKLLT